MTAAGQVGAGAADAESVGAGPADAAAGSTCFDGFFDVVVFLTAVFGDAGLFVAGVSGVGVRATTEEAAATAAGSPSTLRPDGETPARRCAPARGVVGRSEVRCRGELFPSGIGCTCPR